MFYTVYRIYFLEIKLLVYQLSGLLSRRLTDENYN